jgi:GntR family transcriptional regulator/MocR family aminotransferase
VGVPVRGAAACCHQLAAIVEGRLAPGHLLPPSRALAAELGCSRWVVNEAYTQLAAEGQLQTRQGSGTRVTNHPAMRHPERISTIRRASAPLPVTDLRPGAPDVAAFPAPGRR